MKKFTFLFMLFVCAAARAQNGDLSALLGGMVRSDRWLINKNDGTEEFIGNVRYSNDVYSLKADYGLSDAKKNANTLKGDVSVESKESDSVTELKAEEVFYDRKSDEGYVKSSKNAQVELRRKTPLNFFTLFADRIDFSGKFSQYSAKGKAKLSDLNNIIYADMINYDLNNGFLEATGGRPVISGSSPDGSYAAQADALTASSTSKVYAARGRARGWIIPKRSDVKKILDAGKK